MSKKIIKMAHEFAKDKIVTQYDLGINLVKSGIELINNNRNIPRSKVDSYKVQYEHWYSITSETLNEIFLSSDYSYKFRRQISSKKEYVSSSWQPDIKYYITKEIQPKIVYLKMLADNIQSFNEADSQDVNENKKEIMPTDLEKITVSELLGLLKPIQLTGVIATTIAVISAVFYFGYEVHGWKLDKDKYDLTNENNQLNEENIRIKKELSLFKNGKDINIKKK